MKKIKLIFLFFVVVTGSVFANESIAVSLKVKGDVDITRNEEIWKLSTGSELYNKDLLETSEDSFAAIKFIDGNSIVKLFPYSVLEISATKENGKLNKSTKLNMGELWSRVNPQSGSYEVETPTTVVSVKGTQFLLEVSEEGATTLYTFTGKVEMSNKEDGESVVVSAGEQAYSTGSGMIEVVPFDQDEIETELEEVLEQTQILEIQLENEDGEKKTIKIELE